MESHPCDWYHKHAKFTEIGTKPISALKGHQTLRILVEECTKHSSLQHELIKRKKKEELTLDSSMKGLQKKCNKCMCVDYLVVAVPWQCYNAAKSQRKYRQINCHRGTLGALDGSQRLGAFESHLDKTPSHGGTTLYSATQGVEDCQLSLATLESIFYFPNETQLFMLPADKTLFTLPIGTPIRPIVFHGYPQLCLVHLRQDSFTFPAGMLIRLMVCCGYPQFCLLLPILESFQFAHHMFSSTSIMPGEHLVHPPPSARGLVPLAALKGLELLKVISVWIYPKLYLFISQGYSVHFTSCLVSASIIGAMNEPCMQDSLRWILCVIPWLLTNGEEEPSVGDLPIDLQYCTLITIVSHLELSTVDAATLANILLSRSQCEAPSFPSSLAPSTSSSCQEGTAAVPFLPFSPIRLEAPTPPVSIHLTSADTPDSATVLVHGHLDMEPRDPSLADECWHTSTGVFFMVTL
ncbi:hypothetical protein F5J12DRAFT_785060 [Pisolithus orientalis]|uniref:uncharacterized protein n=1 Tax=Pisolithus orientalis TaxID=936130 RepID=UPI0022254D5B|nr:uncharacterized protein F5J12DRAFT_785060 [Pisolithus orientalis]KAI5997845.1 hypothetical protein F5J12DRAFT_785060 [Pisolithus orientalis]